MRIRKLYQASLGGCEKRGLVTCRMETQMASKVCLSRFWVARRTRYGPIRHSSFHFCRLLLRSKSICRWYISGECLLVLIYNFGQLVPFQSILLVGHYLCFDLGAFSGVANLFYKTSCKRFSTWAKALSSYCKFSCNFTSFDRNFKTNFSKFYLQL